MPGITVDTNVGVTDAVVREIAEGTSEVGVVVNMPKATGVRSAWSVRTAVSTVMLSDHPMVRQKEVRLADCFAYPIIMPDEMLLVRAAIWRPLERIRRGVASPARNRVAPIK
jgi:F420-dependent methylenetetrahydromethanopterin dehydrogenase